ncbi:MAG: hypothetical protein JSS29_02600 [Proteobacteria bacterium]|nr:hypothetical protein [Pseudomonadota bacterium]
MRHLGAYSEIVASDLELGARRLRAQFAALLAITVSAALALALGCVWIIAAAWDTGARLQVIAALLGAAVLAAVAGLWYLRRASSRAPAWLSQTREEWANDRRLLEQLLSSEDERRDA